MKKGKNTFRKKVYQQELIRNVENWNFLTASNETIGLMKDYKKNSEDIGIYYEHNLAKSKFGSLFYFDSGYSIDESIILEKIPQNDQYYYYPKLNNKYWSIKEFKGFWPNFRVGESPHVIKLRQANQGYNLLDSKYKIIWSYQNPSRFHFTDLPVIWARNQICAIGSDNREEIIFLLALLNSKVNIKVLTSLLRSKNEKALLISTSSIKRFIRIPRETSDSHQIKNRLIKLFEELLDLESITIENLVDFYGIMTQNFSNVSVVNNDLVLECTNKKLRLPIKKKEELVKRVIEGNESNKLFNVDKPIINLIELKSLPAIDFDEQMKIKKQIDALVFALYFDVTIPSEILDDSERIEGLCSMNKLYTYLNE